MQFRPPQPDFPKLHRRKPFIAECCCRQEGDLIGRDLRMELHFTQTFSDPDEYAAAFGAAAVSITICGPGDFTAEMTRLKLQNMDLLRCSERVSRIAFISPPSDRVFVIFPYGRSSIVSNGHEVRVRKMVFHGRGEQAYQVTREACQWGLLSLTSEQLGETSNTLSGQKLTNPASGQYLRPARAHAEQFHRIFRKACRLAEFHRRGVIEHPEVRRAVEQELLYALVNCLISTRSEPSSEHRQPANVMARFEGIVDNRMNEKLSVPELCAELNIPERTLRTYCTNFLGMGPSKYVLLRRLNRVRGALQKETTSTSTVASIARAHQFLELGRFAKVYRSVFDELPSTTLERSSRA